ncbi:MAG: hypothetical protein BWY77_00256 [bacterium ADurb.Bin431]|nr:MAG: hypothetical protein BWY77_00256 [bacterium ADurb.Bin431]
MVAGQDPIELEHFEHFIHFRDHLNNFEITALLAQAANLPNKYPPPRAADIVNRPQIDDDLGDPVVNDLGQHALQFRRGRRIHIAPDPEQADIAQGADTVYCYFYTIHPMPVCLKTP